MWNCPAFPKWTFATSSKSVVLCVFGHCHVGKSHHCLEDCDVPSDGLSQTSVWRSTFRHWLYYRRSTTQHTWVPDDGGSLWQQLVLLKTASSWVGQGVSSPRLWVKWQIRVSSPLTTQFRQLYPCSRKLTGDLFYCFVVNAEGIHLALTVQYSDLSTTICCTVSYVKTSPGAIYRHV